MKILRKRDLSIDNLSPLKIETEISEKEYKVLKGLSKNGGFKDTWEKVKGKDYEDMMDELYAHFSAKLLKDQ